MKKKVEVRASLGAKFRIEGTMGKHSAVVDQPADAYGDDGGATPLQYILFSLGACQATLARIIAMQKRIELKKFDVTVEGELDTDVLLGKSSGVRCGFEGITVRVDMDADMTDEQKREFIHEVDRRCPVSENILNATPVKLELV